MTRDELEKKGFELFDTGFCCAEALSKTIIDNFAERPESYSVNVASAFCGGVGRSHEDVCGAFTGGVIATGFLYGRKEKGKDLSKACAVVSRFREQFIEAFGSTNCELILKKLGDQEKFIKCKKLTAKATGMLADIIILAEREKL